MIPEIVIWSGFVIAVCIVGCIVRHHQGLAGPRRGIAIINSALGRLADVTHKTGSQNRF
jgi:hypothetical protein